MAGRAGRRAAGEVFVFETSDRLQDVVRLMTEALPPVQSALRREERGLARALLEVTCLGLVTSEHSLHEYLRGTLVAQQSSAAALRANVCESLGFLQAREIIHCYDYHGQLVMQASRLGRAISSSSLPIEESALLYRDLFGHQSHVPLDSMLFLVFLVTPTFAVPALSWSRFEQVRILHSLQRSWSPDCLHRIARWRSACRWRRNSSRSARTHVPHCTRRSRTQTPRRPSCAR